MLRVSNDDIAAHTAGDALVGFARVGGDPYVAQVLDVITHLAYRRRGIATRCMRGVLSHLQQSRDVSVTLTDGRGIAGFYPRFGFQTCKDVEQRWERGTETINLSQSDKAIRRHKVQILMPIQVTDKRLNRLRPAIDLRPSVDLPRQKEELDHAWSQ